MHVKEAALGLGLFLLAGFAWRHPPTTPHPLRKLLYILWGLVAYQLLLHGGLHPAVDSAGWGEAMLRWLLLLGVLHLCLPAQPTGHGAAWRWNCQTALLISALACALLGLGQYFELLPFLFPVFPGYEQAVYSVFGNQDLFGAYLALGLVLMAEMLYQRPRTMRTGQRLCYLAAALILGWGLLLSQSRSAWLATALGLAWLLIRRREQLPRGAALKALALRWGVPLVLGILLLGWYQADVLSERITQTFSEADTGGRLRLWFWEGAVRMIGAHAFIGVGLGNFAYWSPPYLAEALHDPWLLAQHGHNTIHTLHAHSDPLELLAEFGLLALPGFLAIAVLLRRSGLLGSPVTVAFLLMTLINPLLRSMPHLLFLALYWLSRVRRPAAEPGAGDGQHTSKADAAPRQNGTFFARALPATGMALWLAAHTAVVLIPSYRLTQAEDAHLALLHADVPEGEAAPSADAVRAAYQYCLAWPVRRPQAWENAGKLELMLGNYEMAWAYLKEATRQLDSGSVHWHAAQAAQHVGDVEAARNHLLACLYRWPEHEAALQQLYALSSPPERGAPRDP